MKLILINLYPEDTLAPYLLSSYVLKAYLDKFFANDKEMSVEVLNFSVQSNALEICREIIKRNPDCIGYSSYIWNIERIVDVVKCLKARINCIHIFGGPEISLNMIEKLPDMALADYYVIGEGERRLAKLLTCLKDKTTGSGSNIPKGIASWNKGKIEYSEDQNKMTNLNDIPSIYLNAVLDDSLYKGRQAFLETQRGCKYKCRYCVYHKNLSSISYYSLERTFAELDHLIIKKQIFALRIFDAIFTSDLARAKKIVQHLIRIKEDKNIRLPWIYWEFNYSDVDEEFIKLVVCLRCRGKILNTNEISALDRPQLYSDMLKGYTAVNCVGIQSFCGEALKAAGRKGVKAEELEDFMNMAKKYNIALKIDLILGLPFETFESYFEGLEFFLPFLEDTDHILNIHRLQILPGSDLEGMCDSHGVRYSLKAPHLVFSTRDFLEEEMNYASKLNAVLFRILNSPLRRYFFEARRKTGKSFYELMESIFKRAAAVQDFKKSRLLQNEYVDDTYWNNDIFREIPSQWLADALKAN